MEQKNKKMYAAPSTEAVEVQMNSLLCASDSQTVMFYEILQGTLAEGLGRNDYDRGLWQ